MNSSSDDNQDSAGPSTTYLYFVGLLGILYAALIVINATTLAGFAKFEYLRKQRNALIASLTVSDFGHGLTGLVAMIWTTARENRDNCIYPIEIFAISMNATFLVSVSYFSIIMIGVDRFIAITFPLHYPVLVTRRVTVAMVAASWIVPVIAISLNYLWVIGQPVYDCNYYGDIQPELPFAVGVFVFYFGSLTILLVLYGTVLYQAKIKVDVVNGTKTQLNKKAIRFVSAVFLVVAILNAPYVIYTLLSLQGRIPEESKDLVSLITADIQTLGGCVNAFIYAVCTVEFRRAYREMLCCPKQRTTSVIPITLGD